MGAYDKPRDKMEFIRGADALDIPMTDLANAAAGDAFLKIDDHSSFVVDLSTVFSSTFFDKFPRG